MADIVLAGKTCSAALSDETITLSGNYYRYDDHKRWRMAGPVAVDLLNVLRVGITKTYSRMMFAFPMGFGLAALLIRAIPSVGGYGIEIIPDVWSIDILPSLSLPFQDELWKLCGILCLLTIPLYWLSYRNDLEINTTQGRYLLSRKGMAAAQIAAFQWEFTQLKEARQKTRKGGQ